MRVLLVCGLAVALGCAANPYDTYKAKNPDWYGEAPTVGASLHETLAGLYAPPVAAYTRIVSKLEVLRFEGGSPVLLSQAQLDQALAADEPGDYGVIATLFCQSEVDLKRYAGEKVAWYLLVGNRLVAYDHFDFVDRCTVSSSFRPADAGQAPLERAVIARRDAEFPNSMEHTGELYMKGIAYLGAKRPDDAEAMLKAGDASFDVGARGEQHIDYKNAPQTLRPTKSRQIDDLREKLVQGLKRQKAGQTEASAQ